MGFAACNVDRMKRLSSGASHSLSCARVVSGAISSTSVEYPPRIEVVVILGQRVRVSPALDLADEPRPLAHLPTHGYEPRPPAGFALTRDQLFQDFRVVFP